MQYTRPALLIALCVCFGIVCAKIIPWSFTGWFIAALVLLAWLCVRRGSGGRQWVAVAALVWVCQGGAWYAGSLVLDARDMRTVIRADHCKEYTVHGIVRGVHSTANYCQLSVSVDTLTHAGWHVPSKGVMRVFLEGVCAVRYGDEVKFRSELHIGKDGIFVYCRVPRYGLEVNHSCYQWWDVPRSAWEVNRACSVVLSRYLPALHAGIAKAMVFGAQDDVPASVYAMMIRTGTIHILVVSGFNVGLVAGCFYALLVSVGVSRGTRTFLCMILVAGYCLVAGADTPVVRATIMVVTVLAAGCWRREIDVWNVLGVAALLVVLLDPSQVFDVGAQLSFVSVASLAGLYPYLRRVARLETWKSRLLTIPGEGFLSSLSAWLATAGIIACRFAMISPVTVVTNMVVVPLATLVTLTGCALLACGLWCPYLATYVASTCQCLIATMLAVIAGMDRIPGAYFYWR